MTAFPRTTVGGVSLSRMIVGTNWFLGFSHTSSAKDKHIKTAMTRSAIADVLEVFFRAGVNTVMGMIQYDPLADAIKDAEDKTGVKAIVVSTPSFPTSPELLEHGFDTKETHAILEKERAMGATFCMPHTGTTDALVDKCARSIRKVDTLCTLIREYGMIPGLSTHMPEAIVLADETGLDVETYISLYNAIGFLMQVEVDWIAQVIRQAKKPVMTIKPMAAGRIPPFQAMHFVWNTIRPQDMVTVGTMTPDEATELIELSLSILEQRNANIALQETRSKRSLKPCSS